MTFVIGGVPMQLPIMLGGGVCKFVHQLNPYLRPDLPVGALEIGSFTPPPRDGNPGSPQWPDTYEELERYHATVNAWNMPNEGFQDTALKLANIQSPHPLVANIAGFKPADFVEGVKTFEALPNVAATTLNFGCPNTENIPIAYDLTFMKATLDALRAARPQKPVWVKISPYVTLSKLQELAKILGPQLPDFSVDLALTPVAEGRLLEKVLRLIDGYDFVLAVIIANTLGNVRFYNQKTGEPIIKVNQGKAGLAGDIVRDEIVLPMIQHAAHFFRHKRMSVIGSQGVRKGNHVLDYLMNGADAVQCVSGPSWYPGGGPRFFSNLISESPELQDYLAQHTS